MYSGTQISAVTWRTEHIVADTFRSKKNTLAVLFMNSKHH